MKKFGKRLFLIVIALMILILGIPLLLNSLYHIPALESWFVWEAGDVLGYYGALIGCVVSFLVLYLTIKAERHHEKEKELEENRVILEFSRFHANTKPKRASVYYTSWKPHSSGIKEDVLLIENVSAKHIVNVSICYKYIVENASEERTICLTSIHGNSQYFICMPDEIANVTPWPSPDLDEIPHAPKAGTLTEIVVIYHTASHEKMKAVVSGDFKAVTYFVLNGQKATELFSSSCSRPVDFS
ncbi:MAG: hypothetical protein ACI4O7_12810 [Aristaeellaceae bacterium]